MSSAPVALVGVSADASQGTEDWSNDFDFDATPPAAVASSSSNNSSSRVDPVPPAIAPDQQQQQQQTTGYSRRFGGADCAAGRQASIEDVDDDWAAAITLQDGDDAGLLLGEKQVRPQLVHQPHLEEAETALDPPVSMYCLLLS